MEGDTDGSQQQRRQQGTGRPLLPARHPAAHFTRPASPPGHAKVTGCTPRRWPHSPVKHVFTSLHIQQILEGGHRRGISQRLGRTMYVACLRRGVSIYLDDAGGNLSHDPLSRR